MLAKKEDTEMANAYKCECGGKVTREILGEVTGKHEVWWRCSRDGKLYGLPFMETDWEQVQDPCPTLNLQPWPEDEMRAETVAPQHKSARARRAWAVLRVTGISAASILLAIGSLAIVYEMVSTPYWSRITLGILS